MTLGTPDGRLSDVLNHLVKTQFPYTSQRGRLIYTMPKPQQEGKAAESREESLARGVTVGTGDWQADRGTGEGTLPLPYPSTLSELNHSFVSGGWCSLSARTELTVGMMEGQCSRCKIVVVGDTQCGKTALLNVFAKDNYPEVNASCYLSFLLLKQKISY